MSKERSHKSASFVPGLVTTPKSSSRSTWISTVITDTFCRWDVTLAFLSREDLRLPLSYLEMLLKCGDSPECSFFVLNGCSIELVMAMARLAKLAAIYEKTRQMEWTIFDTTPVETRHRRSQKFRQ